MLSKKQKSKDNRIDIYYHHTQSPNGGFGVLGKGIYENLLKDKRFNIVGYNELIPTFKPRNIDIIFTYGTPELVDDIALPLKKSFKKAIHYHYAVWESSELPENYLKIYKKVDHMMTASTYTKKSFKKANIITDIWHHAVDSRFKLISKKKEANKPFTFLHHNAYEYRKGWEIVLTAFTEEFHLEENVKLIFKARERKHSVWLFPKFKRWTPELLKLKKENPDKFNTEYFNFKHPLINEIIGHVSDKKMVQINSEANVFIFPAKGEGWGLPPFEAAAMGILPIIPNKSSFTEWFNPECMLEVKVLGYLNSAPRYPGYMYECSTKDLRKKMRWCFENQDKVKKMGIKASKYILKNYNWKKTINELFEIFNKYK